MRIEIIQTSGDLKREVWEFWLSVGYTHPCIYFQEYSFQTRETKRHRLWEKQTHWSRLNRRDNNIDTPPIPEDVETEMRQLLADKVRRISIVQ